MPVFRLRVAPADLSSLWSLSIRFMSLHVSELELTVRNAWEDEVFCTKRALCSAVQMPLFVQLKLALASFMSLKWGLDFYIL